jgi:NAD+ synthase
MSLRMRLMELSPSTLDLNWSDVETKISRFIKDYVEKSTAEGMIIGLSGGIDSSTVAMLCAHAVGGSRVFGLILPEKETFNKKDVDHAKLVSKQLKMSTKMCDITPALEAIYNSIPDFSQSEKVSVGNIKARMRMIYLYYYANRNKLLVCGSSDKSEAMMGYFTKWGDVAADISPIMDLYKTQVQKLAKYLGVPQAIIAKQPSPSLWPGQTAEGELGVNYAILDLILFGLEHFMTTGEIAEKMRIKKELVERVKSRWLSAEHKRRLLLTAKFEYRTIGTDFRLKRG